MTIRSRVDSAAPERVPWVDPADWQDAFAPEPDQTPPRHETPAASDAALNVWSRSHDPAAPSPADDPLAEFDLQVDDSTDGLDTRAPQAARWAKRASGAAIVCAVVVAAAGGFLVLQPPAAPPPMIAQPALRALPALPELLAPPDDAAKTENQPAPPPAEAAVAVPEVMRRSRPRLPDAAATTSTAASPVRSRATDRRAAAAEPPAVKAAPRLAAIPTPEVARPRTAPPSANDAPPVEAAALAAPAPAPAVAAPAPASAGPSRAATQVSRDSAAEPPGTGSEIRAVENALGLYRNAFNTLNARAAVLVWPTVNEQALATAFESLDGQNVSFHQCQIETADVRAVAVCSGTARYVPKVGYRARRPEPHRWRFTLHKANDRWLIESVEARAVTRGR